MGKRVIYFMPGLAASPKIFEKLCLPEDKYKLYYLNWIKPLSIEETLANYALRMCEKIKHKQIVLVGVSFGGILIQEMAKHIDTKKLIIISSVKSHKEFPKKLKLAKKLNAHKLFPTKIISNFNFFKMFFIGKSLKKKVKLYEIYLSERDKLYLNWSLKNVLFWNQEPLNNIIHLQGTKDLIFPIKNIKNCTKIKGGTHAMIIFKARQISKIIDTILT